MSERRRRMNYNGAYAGGSMTLFCGGKRLRIERSVAVSSSGGKESARESVSVTDLESGEKIPITGGVGETLLGVPESVFTDTAYIRQLADTGVNGARMSEAIANILFSGDEALDAQKAVDRLDAARRLLLHINGKGGLIYELKNETEQLKKRLEEAMRSNSEIIEKEGAVSERRRAMKEKEERLAAIKKKIEACETAQTLKRINELHTAEKNAADAFRKAEKIKNSRYIADAGFSDALKAEFAAVKSLMSEKSAKEKDIEELSLEAQQYADIDLAEKKAGFAGTAQLFARHEGLRTRKKTTVALGSAFILPAAAFAVAGVLNTIPFLPRLRSFAVSGICLLVAVIMFISAVRAGKKAFDIRAMFDKNMKPGQLSDYIRSHENRKSARDSFMARLYGAENDLEKISQRLQTAQSAVSALLLQAGESPDKNTADYIAQFISRLEADRREYDSTLSEAESQTKLAFSLKTAVGEADENALRAKLAELNIPEPDKTDLAAARREREFYEQQTALLRDKIHGFELRLAELEAKRENPVELNGRLSEAEEKLYAETKRLNAYKTAIEAISKASANLRSGVAPKLAHYACEAVGVMTDGKYGNMHIGSTLELTYDADGAARSLEFLSAGTRDVAYTALRFALVDLLYKKEKPPVIFDESLAHQDSRRTAGIFKMLGRLSGEGVQSLVFTCREREAEVAGKTIGKENFTHIKL